MLTIQDSYQSYEVHTRDELDSLLKDKDFAKPDRLRLIEVFLPRGDAPAPLLKQAKLTAEAVSCQWMRNNVR